MRISTLANDISARGFACVRAGSADPELRGVTCDSRNVTPGDLFVALPGTKTDGGRYIADALRAGAAAIVCTPQEKPDGAPALLLDDVARAAGHIAAAVYGNPTRRLGLVGVTGTNGKTSTTYLLESIWNHAGENAGVIGTVSVRWPGHEEKAAMTTPAAPQLQESLRAMADAGCRWVSMEVSSHALSQHRVAGCMFQAAIFTNLTRDHLDYHGDEESYFAAKASLFFDYLADDGIAVLNADDPYSARIESRLAPERVRTFSLDAQSHAWARPIDVACTLDGLHGRIRLGDDVVALDTPLIGLPNLANVLGASATARVLGLAPHSVEAGLRACAPVPGRVERVDARTPVVLVDYAHTPDALERTLASVRTMTRGRLIVVFGCGGDRDRGKRPIMGRIGAERADISVLTSDNPRSEEPLAILSAIEAGIDGRKQKAAVPVLAARPDARGYVVEPDRARAIELALEIARRDDVVVIAGKGHEDYQEIAGVRRPFDDRETVRRLFGTLSASA